MKPRSLSGEAPPSPPVKNDAPGRVSMPDPEIVCTAADHVLRCIGEAVDRLSDAADEIGRVVRVPSKDENIGILRVSNDGNHRSRASRMALMWRCMSQDFVRFLSA
jgi:hypothetical protein